MWFGIVFVENKFIDRLWPVKALNGKAFYAGYLMRSRFLMFLEHRFGFRFETGSWLLMSLLVMCLDMVLA